MRKTLTALTAATIIVVSAIAMPTTADARTGLWWGPPLAGFALGALVGSAFARPYYSSPYYGYGYGYPGYRYGYPAYSYGYPAYGYGYGPGCSGYGHGPSSPCYP